MQFMIPFLKLKEDNCLRSYVDNLSVNEDSNEVVMKIVDIKNGMQFLQSSKVSQQDVVMSEDEEKHEVYEIETLEPLEDEIDHIEDTNPLDADHHHQHQQQQQEPQQEQHTITMQEYDLDQLPYEVQSPPMKKFKLTEVSSPPPPPALVSTCAPQTQSSVQDDADLSFLKSLVPDIQQMNSQQKRKFKVAVLNLVDELLSANEKS